MAGGGLPGRSVADTEHVYWRRHGRRVVTWHLSCPALTPARCVTSRGRGAFVVHSGGAKSAITCIGAATAARAATRGQRQANLAVQVTGCPLRPKSQPVPRSQLAACPSLQLAECPSLQLAECPSQPNSQPVPRSNSQDVRRSNWQPVRRGPTRSLSLAPTRRMSVAAQVTHGRALAAQLIGCPSWSSCRCTCTQRHDTRHTAVCICRMGGSNAHALGHVTHTGSQEKKCRWGAAT